MKPRMPVVLVLGAGAGVDLNMPTGRKLQDTISSLTLAAKQYDDEDPKPWAVREMQSATSRSFPGKEGAILSALRQIHEGVYLRASIDDYLDRHRANEVVNVCGKITIAKAILQHERSSSLFFEADNIYSTLDFNKIRDSWLIRFWQMLGSGTATEEIAESLDHITIINFNYDRCIEQFLIQALRSLDRWPPKEAHDFVYNQMKIYHPYGVVGKLPLSRQEPGVAFGEEKPDLLPFGKAIKTYTEQIEEDESLTKIRRAIATAETMIFLGFHFHRQNVDLLNPSLKSRLKRTYATVQGISNEDQSMVRNQIASLTEHREEGLGAAQINLVQGDCLKLFSTFEKTLRL